MFRSLRGLAKRCLLAPAPPFFYVITHERSGTHLLINTLIRNCWIANHHVTIGEWQGPFDRPAARFGPVEAFRPADLSTRGFPVKSHCDRPLFEAAYPDAPVVYVRRDPRDVLTSYYHFLERYELGTFSAFLRQPLPDALRLGASLHGDFANPVERWCHHVRGWTGSAGCLEVTFEDLLRDPLGEVRRVAGFLGVWRRPRQRPVRMGEMHSIRPRKGTVGDWRGHFGEGDLEHVRDTVEQAGISWAWATAAAERWRGG